MGFYNHNHNHNGHTFSEMVLLYSLEFIYRITRKNSILIRSLILSLIIDIILYYICLYLICMHCYLCNEPLLIPLSLFSNYPGL